MSENKWAIRKKFALASGVVFAFSLSQTCYYTGKEGSIGFLVLIFGWMGFAMGSGAAISWFANPLLALSIYIARKNQKLALFSSIGSFLLSFSFLLFDSVVANEGGGSQTITSVGIGYWAWLASHLIWMAAMFYTFERGGKPGAGPEDKTRYLH